MNETPLVSVIICAHNAQDFIGETLESVLAQTFPRVEVIVVDDGSRDDTATIVRKFGRGIHYAYQENQGSSSARNFGLGISGGKYLLFFDADDLMPRERIARQVAYMERNPELGLSFVDYRNFNESGPSAETHFQSCPRLQESLKDQEEVVLDNPCEALLHENFGITGTMMIRSTMLELEPGFEPDLRGAEDLNFYYRLARHTRIGLINAVGMLRRLHGNNLSSHLHTMLPSIIENYSRLYRSEGNPCARRLLEKRIGQAWRAWARHEANQRRFRQAVTGEFNAFRADPMPLAFVSSARNLCRAFAIAVRLHHPAEMPPVPVRGTENMR